MIILKGTSSITFVLKVKIAERSLNNVQTNTDLSKLQIKGKNLFKFLEKQR